MLASVRRARFPHWPDRAGAKRAMEAMLAMTKIDVEKLREAYEGVPA